MADPVFDGETIADLDVDKLAEGTVRLKHLNDAAREIITCVQGTFEVDHYNDTGKHREQYFTKVVSISMNTAATSVEILADTEVTEDRKPYPLSIYGYCSADVTGVADETINYLYIKTNDDTNLWRIRYDKLVSGAHFDMLVHRDGSTLSWLSNGAQTAIQQGTGGTANKGLKVVGDVNGSGGATVYLTVFGVIK